MSRSLMLVVVVDGMLRVEVRVRFLAGVFA